MIFLKTWFSKTNESGIQMSLNYKKQSRTVFWHCLIKFKNDTDEFLAYKNVSANIKWVVKENTYSNEKRKNNYLEKVC